jgi:hypothetical protein
MRAQPALHPLGREALNLPDLPLPATTSYIFDGNQVLPPINHDTAR